MISSDGVDWHGSTESTASYFTRYIDICHFKTSHIVDTGHTLYPNLTEQATEVVIVDYTTWTVNLKIMGNSFSMCLERPKNLYPVVG